MPIIARKSHTKDGIKIYIRVGESPPVVKDGKIKEGAFFVIVGDDTGEKSIRLTDQEALDIAYRIITIYQSHVRLYRKLDQKTYEEYKQTHSGKESNNMELEIVRFLISRGGESTVEEIRTMLGVKYADYLPIMEGDEIVKIVGNKVILNIKKEK